MKLQQLRYIWEVARHNLNVSATAQGLYTSQPGISKQIRLLEDELGVEIFLRSGKHLTKITPAGKKIIEKASEILQITRSIKQIAQEFNNESQGDFRLVAGQIQAQYQLPSVISQFIDSYPDISLQISQQTLPEMVKSINDGHADIMITNEDHKILKDLVMIPCYTWCYGLIVPKNHPLTSAGEITAEKLAAYSFIVYGNNVLDDSKFNHILNEHNIKPNIIFSGTDSNIIKTYVRSNLGVGIIDKRAYHRELDQDLVLLNVDHLFKPGVVKIGFKKDSFIRNYMCKFIELFAPRLGAELISQAVLCKSTEEVSDLIASKNEYRQQCN